MKMKYRKSNPRHIVDSGIVLVLIIGFLIVPHFFKQEPSHWEPAIPERISPVPEAWSHQGLFITTMLATENKLLFIGSYAPGDEPFRLIALDKDTGNRIWQYSGGDTDSLAVSENLVFVGQVGRVTAVNLDNGIKTWSTTLPFTRSVTKLIVKDNVLHVDTVSSSHFLLDVETGQILRQIPYTVDNSPNVEVPGWSDHNMNLEFVENISFFQKQKGWPDVTEIQIVATDELTGNQIWTSTVPAVCRISANSRGVYVLTGDGRLLRLNTMTGIHQDLIQFSPAPIKRHITESAIREMRHYVAVDKDDQMLFVYFEDSAQLFAYRLPISP
jgi:hypothetical protein